MEFTYDAYMGLLSLLEENGYGVRGYKDAADETAYEVILRHDVDLDLGKALKFAELERTRAGVSSTYFVRLSGGYYNIFYRENIDIIKRIAGEWGHTIGLHFDEMRYAKELSELSGDAQRLAIEKYVADEIRIMSEVLELDIDVVSMHRPSKLTLNREFDFGRVINSYSRKFFKEYKYLSDSRAHWREDAAGIIKSREYKKLHILTHAESYSEKTASFKQILLGFIGRAGMERYRALQNDVTMDGLFTEADIAKIQQGAQYERWD